MLKYLKNLIELDGIGMTQIKSIDNFSIEKNNKILINLIRELNIANQAINNLSGKFSNKKLMFTGGV